jgi:hypothetical protein
MDKLYDDTMTRKMRHDLSRFCYEQGFLEYDDAPSIGHWPDDAPDPFYFQAQGQEPPSQTKERRLNWLVRNWEFSLMMVVIAVLLVLLAIYSR